MRQSLPSCAVKSVHSFWMWPSIWVVDVGVPHRNLSGNFNTLPFLADMAWAQIRRDEIKPIAEIGRRLPVENASRSRGGLNCRRFPCRKFEQTGFLGLSSVNAAFA